MPSNVTLLFLPFGVKPRKLIKKLSLSENIPEKYTKLRAVFISSAIATLVGISIRTFFLSYLEIDLINFPLHPILCSIYLFSICFIRFGVKLLVEQGLQKYPKLRAVFISSAIATLVGISIRTFLLCYLDLDLLNFPLHPILCSIHLFSINFIGFCVELLLEQGLFPIVLMMDNTGEGSTSPSTPAIGGTSKPATGSAIGGTSKQATGSAIGGRSNPATGSAIGGTSKQATGSAIGGRSNPATGSAIDGTSEPGTGSLVDDIDAVLKKFSDLKKLFNDSTSASTAPIGGTSEAATGSRLGDIDGLLKRTTNFDKDLKLAVFEATCGNYFDLLKEYKDVHKVSFQKEIQEVDDLLMQYSGSMEIEQEKKYAKARQAFSIEDNYLMGKYKSLNIWNDPTAIRRIILHKEILIRSIDMQDIAGNLIRESMLKGYKEGKIPKVVTQEFLAPWVEFTRNRPILKGGIIQRIAELETKDQLMDSTIYGGQKGSK